tara:strand:+ start:3056 stop:5305 length:2250 start_codon:yes stop_codon:yes gene_type:complete
MANIRKSFNFREGVKVDDSVLVVVGDRVGIGTTAPVDVLDIKGDVSISNGIIAERVKITGISTFMGNVGIGTTNITGAASTTNTTILNAGIVTAISYYGDASTLSNLPTSPFSNATYGKYVLSSNIGIGSTNPVYDLQIGNDPASGNGVGIDSLSGNIRTSGIITATKFVGPFVGNIIGQADYALVAAAATTAGYASTAGISTTSQGLTGTPDISVTGIAGTSATFTGVVTATSFVGDLTGTASVASVALALSQGAAYSADNIIGGIGSFGSVGIGTTNPATDIQIVNPNNAVITLGRANSATGNNGAIGFGKVSGSFPYSDANSLDILNYGIGNINFYLEAGTPGVSTGNFYWHRRGNYNRLMTLTNAGQLSIGGTQPTTTLQVVGTSTVTNKAYFGNDVEVAGDVTTQGLSATSLSISQLTANLVGNVNAASGLSTFTNVKVTSRLGINTEASSVGLYINTKGSAVFADSSGYIGIKTDATYFEGINAYNTQAIISAVGIGTTLPRSVADFADAGATGIVTTNRFLIPPSITSTERTAIATVQDGALIYNETNDRLEVYPNSTIGWVGISTGSSGGGGGGASTLNDLTDVNAGSPTDNQALSWDSSTSKWIPQTVVTDDSRTTKAGTTSSIAKDASADLSITGFKSYALLKVAISAPAWVVLYTNDTTRTADDSRAEGTDPTPGSGVIAEVLTTTAGASTFVMSPGVIGWNDDGSPSTTIYAKVKNKRSSSGSNAITVTLTVLKLES